MSSKSTGQRSLSGKRQETTSHGASSQPTSDELLLTAQSALTHKAIELALSGNGAMLKICLERIAALNDDRSTVSIPVIRTMDDVLSALSLITQACANGDMSVGDGEALARLVGCAATALRDVDLAKRLAALEGASCVD